MQVDQEQPPLPPEEIVRLDSPESGILSAPDYLGDAGGIIDVAAEYLGWSEAEARERVKRIGPRLTEVHDLAESNHLAPHQAADALARSIIAGKRHAAPAV